MTRTAASDSVGVVRGFTGCAVGDEHCRDKIVLAAAADQSRASTIKVSVAGSTEQSFVTMRRAPIARGIVALPGERSSESDLKECSIDRASNEHLEA